MALEVFRQCGGDIDPGAPLQLVHRLGGLFVLTLHSPGSGESETRLQLAFRSPGGAAPLRNPAVLAGLPRLLCLGVRRRAAYPVARGRVKCMAAEQTFGVDPAFVLEGLQQGFAQNADDASSPVTVESGCQGKVLTLLSSNDVVLFWSVSVKQSVKLVVS